MSKCTSGMDLINQEYRTLKVPYETLNKKFRNSQKVIDREAKSMKDSLQKDLRSPGITNADVVKHMKMLIEKFKSYKRKVSFKRKISLKFMIKNYTLEGQTGFLYKY